MSDPKCRFVYDWTNGCKLTLDMNDMLDAMTAEDKMELACRIFCEDDLTAVLAVAVAGYTGAEKEVSAIKEPVGDSYRMTGLHFGRRDVSAVREALMPLLSAAHADEMKLANEKAEKAQERADALRSLVHVIMLRDSAKKHGTEALVGRVEQYQAELTRCLRLLLDGEPPTGWMRTMAVELGYVEPAVIADAQRGGE